MALYITLKALNNMQKTCLNKIKQMAARNDKNHFKTLSHGTLEG